jgi:pimeloyl-ACP methyl ester carboxylesterase
MTGMEMTLLGLRLRNQGFTTLRFHYDSRRVPVETNAERLARFTNSLPSGTVVHFVCHSLGGLVLCRTLGSYADSLSCKIGRIVLLGSPVNGSTVARRTIRWKIAHYAAGKSLHTLACGCPPSCSIEAGMLAGSVNLGIGMFFLNSHLPADGLVALEDTRADWITEHVMIRTNHIGLLLSATAAKFAGNFLKNGTFGTVR